MAGNIKVIKPQNAYVPVSKGIIYDKRVDALALGMFVKVVGLSDRWELNVNGIATAFGMSREKVQKCIRMLEECGYLTRTKAQDEHGKFCGWDYVFYNVPNSTDDTEIRLSEKPDVGEIRPSENRAVYNNSISNTETIKKKNNKRENIPAREFDFLTALMDMGVSAATAADWMEVRKAARAVNTETAFRRIAAEVEKTGAPAEDCIALAVCKCWRGFEAEWWRNAQPRPERGERNESVYAHNVREMQKLNGYEH